MQVQNKSYISIESKNYLKKNIERHLRVPRIENINIIKIRKKKYENVQYPRETMHLYAPTV